MENQNPQIQNTENHKSKSFWYIVIIVILSAIVGGLLTYAIYNQGLEEEISSLAPGFFHAKSVQQKNATMPVK